MTKESPHPFPIIKNSPIQPDFLLICKRVSINIPIFIFHVFLLALLHRLQLTEVSRQQIEDELGIVNKEKADIIEQFQQVKHPTLK